jgi:colicin import membrane protein
METEQQSTALVLVGELPAPQLLFAPGALDPILERIRAEVRAIDTDISTETGRKAIGSLALKVSKTKTFIEDRRLALVADEKRRLAVIDSEGKRFRDALDELRDEVKKPLEEWLESEAKRMRSHESRIAMMHDVADALFIAIASVDNASKHLDELFNHDFQEFAKRATQAHERARLHLDACRERIVKDEAERIEKERAEAEAAEKRRIEREAKIAEDARIKAEAAAKKREEEQAAAAKRREEEVAEAVAKEKARAEKAAEERERQAEADKVEAATKAERERIAAVDAERQRQRDADARAEKERLNRQANKGHREAAHALAINHLVACTIEQSVAETVIDVIARGLIPGVTITY